MKNYRDPEKVCFPDQAPRSMIVPDYKVNADGELVEVGKIDLQEIIDSNLKSTLDAILDKFLAPTLNPVQDARRMDVDFLQDDLENLTEAKEFFDECRERYGRPGDSDEQILDFIRQEAEKNKTKGASKDEAEKQKKTEPEKKSETVPEDGEQNPPQKS